MPAETDEQRQAREARECNSTTVNNWLRAQMARRQRKVTLRTGDPALGRKVTDAIRRATGRAGEGTDDE